MRAQLVTCQARVYLVTLDDDKKYRVEADASPEVDDTLTIYIGERVYREGIVKRVERVQVDD